MASENRLYSKWILYLPVIFIAILFFIFMIPEILSLTEGIKVSVPVLSDIPYSDRLIILLTFAITIFTMVGSYSTYLQVVFAQATSRIEDARNELEKAYGPLYSILNYPVRVEEKSVKIAGRDFKTIDGIISVYPWMFPERVRDSWNETRRPTPSISEREMSMGQTEPLHDVPLEFRDMINEEYRHRVERYDKLLGKDRGLQPTSRKMSEKKVVRRNVAIALGLICIIVAASLGVLTFIRYSAPQNSTGVTVKVGVYYYLWYGNSNGSGGLGSPHWNDSEGNVVVDTPVDGFYSSNNGSEIYKQLKEMTSIGIDFVVASWWGPNSTQNPNNNYIDSNIRLMFGIINSDSLPIQAAILVEPFNQSGVYDFPAIYNYIYDTFVEPYGNIYMKLDNKYLLLFYNDQDHMTPNGTIETDGRFDSIIGGHQDYTDWVYWSFDIPSPQPWAQENQPVCKDGEIDVCPRYDDSHQRTPYHQFDTHYSEGYYDKQWANAIDQAGAGNVKIVMISTWNEYHERTQIEPCKDLTSAYNSDYIYTKTKAYITELRSSSKSAQQQKTN